VSEHEPWAEVVDEGHHHDRDDGDASDQRQAPHGVGDRRQPLTADRHELVVLRKALVTALSRDSNLPHLPMQGEGSRLILTPPTCSPFGRGAAATIAIPSAFWYKPTGRRAAMFITRGGGMVAMVAASVAIVAGIGTWERLA
jgi:hypothetical protein